MAAIKDIKITDLRFSPDNSKLMFDYQPKDKPSRIAVYDFVTKTLGIYEPPENEVWFDGNYSPDGKQIVYVVHYHQPRENYLHGQVAVMDLDGKNRRVLTDTPYWKRNPSFSPDGSKLIFLNAMTTERTKEGRSRIGSWDVFDMPSAGGPVRRLTHYEFRGATAPFYFPDNKRFVFHGEGPFWVPGTESLRSTSGNKIINAEINAEKFSRIRRDFKEEHEKKYGENFIYVMTPSNTALDPIVPIAGHNFSIDPGLSHDGRSLLITVKTNKLDGLIGGNYNYDLYVYDFRGARRLTNLKSTISESTLSPNGNNIAFIVDDTHRDSKIHFLPPTQNLRLHVGQVDGRVEEITLPPVTRVLNV